MGFKEGLHPTDLSVLATRWFATSASRYPTSVAVQAAWIALESQRQKFTVDLNDLGSALTHNQAAIARLLNTARALHGRSDRNIPIDNYKLCRIIERVFYDAQRLRPVAPRELINFLKMYEHQQSLGIRSGGRDLDARRRIDSLLANTQTRQRK